MPTKKSASISSDEIARFSAQSEDWWLADGDFAPLHKLNPVRLAYVRDQAVERLKISKASPYNIFSGLKLLDVGCGGGLLAEPMARLGAKVTGIDASEAGIKAARAHARQSGLEISYQATSVEEVAAKGKQYDVVTAMEIVEHVADMNAFSRALADCLHPGGLLVASTLNRTAKSYAMGIVAAEYILRWVPRGTHQWKKFVRPSELMRALEQHGLRVVDATGVVYNPLHQTFSLDPRDLSVNYMVAFVKD
ncbi:MAG: bifunctional 2-polyprenyl-6-hydroxyphenol methylase/3-demethylubiquinol 3-O-methyltransferase UbiG [Alphaproteobacteria bacterium]|nr:bifunctional 2-polyprenyl-6-hydroxyphenol methylase/3-demethylubiquinol 3-O-methyltransferase UbiG [Alphaproteobacteria bacterium]MBV8549209.1 bifunctional 2-polyprenyl-6-hydroxyphenol methylase/3-demethylubiquinol 3-O-methyltransferase UbiG [Alphaproteobacteria bacterium]